MNTMYAGLDLHSNTTEIAVINEDGEFIDNTRCATEADALQRALGRWSTDHTVWAVLEQGEQSYWAAAHLAQVADEVRICDPTDRRRHPGNKNDALDARQLARRLRLGDTKHLYRPRMGRRMRFRRRFAYYQRATEEVKKQIQYVKSQLRFWGVRIRKRAGWSRQKAARWLSKAPAEVRPDLQRLVDQLARKRQWKRQAWKQVEQLGTDYWEIDQFRRIPGIGPVRSHGLSALLMDPDRFDSRSALYKYCRLAVQRRSTDGELTAPEQLDHRGHGRLKAIVAGAVRSAVFRQTADNEVKASYHASLQRTGGHCKHAQLNTQRKLLKTCWGLWKSETNYDPGRFRPDTG